MRKLSTPSKPRKNLIVSPSYGLGLIAIIAVTVVVALSFVRDASSSSKLESQPEEYTFIPVPLRQVQKGDSLAKIEFVSVKWPKSQLSTNFLTDLAELKPAYASQTLVANLPVSREQISQLPPDSNVVVDRIPPGMRAVSVKVDAESAVEGWAQTGNYVDVLLISKGEAQKSSVETQVIAENVRVLSVGRSVDSKNTAPSALTTDRGGLATVTLLVNQSDALKVKTASTIGRLAFSLRGLGDEEPSETRGMSDRELLVGTPSAAPKKRMPGYAVGPDGKKYLLAENEEWIINQ